VYSPVIKRSGYSGKAFTVRNSTDTASLDINFLANGVADFASADAFDPLWRCIELPDSINTYNLAPRSFAFAPVNYGFSLGSNRAITFDNLANRDLQNATLPVTQVRNCTIIDVIRPWSSHRGQRIWGLGAVTSTLNVDLLTNSGFGPGYQMSAAAQPSVLAYVTNGAGNRRLVQNSRVSSVSSAPTSAAATGIIFGNNVAGNSTGRYELVARVVFDSTLNTTQQAAEMAEAARAFGVRTAQRPAVLMFGDSITQWNPNASNLVNHSWAYRLADAYNSTLDFYNLGSLGQTASGMVASTFNTLLDRAFVTGQRNDCIIAYGTNDLAANATGATVYSNLITLVGQAKTKGCTKVALQTPVVRGASFSGGATALSFETERQALRTLMLAGVGVDFDVLIDVGGDATLGNSANATNAAILYDFIHPTSSSYDIYFNSYYNAAIPTLTT
jgi:hypothetical protein